MKTSPSQCQMDEKHFLKKSGAICLGYYNKSFDRGTIDERDYKPYIVDVPPLSMKFPDEKPKTEPPRDKWHALRIILIIQGLATLMPWNMFINAQSYFQDYKLSTTNETVGMVKHYHDNFMSYVTVCSMLPSISFSAMNTFITRSSMASPMRMVAAKGLMIALLIVTIILAAIDTTEYKAIFFIITMLTIVLINAASSIFQNCLFGISSILPGKYITAVIFGSNFAGILTSVASIISIAISSNDRTSAFFYFSTAIATLVIALVTNIIFQKLPLFLHYKNNISKSSQDVKDTKKSRPPFWKIFKKMWIMCFNLWFTFTVTILNFPNIVSQIKRIEFPIDDIYWIPVWCFLNFNTFAVVGTLPSNWIKWPGPRTMWIVVIVRALIFLPLFVLSNYIPNERVIPAYFANDYVYIVGIMLLASTNSHITSLCFIHTPSLLEGNEAAVGGMILNIFLFLGILSGGLISFAFKPLVKCC